VALTDIVEAGPETHRTGFVTIVREVAASGIAAALAGLIAGGVGGRLAMRVSALLNSSVIGARTENGNRIGSITADGTLGLLIFGGLLTGAVAAVAWVAVRPWLPDRAAWRYPLAALTAVGLVGFFVIESDNLDFLIVGPAWAHVAMFTAIVAGAGALTAWFDRHLVARWRESRRFTIVAIVVGAQGVLLALPALGAFFSRDFCFCKVPPRPAGTLLIVVLALTAATWIARMGGREIPARLRDAGGVATALAVALGAIHLGGQIAAIV